MTQIDPQLCKYTYFQDGSSAAIIYFFKSIILFFTLSAFLNFFEAK